MSKPPKGYITGDRLRDLIADREDFQARTVFGEWVDGVVPIGDEGLVEDDLSTFLDDAPFIRYVVYSYATPIHWVGTCAGEDDWYTIKRPPSKTTTGHRNKCPGYKPWPREGGKGRDPNV